MTLQELTHNQVAIVQEVTAGHTEIGFKVRLEAMGLIPGKPVRILRKAILGGPLQVRVGSTTEIAIRRQEAELVRVSLLPE